MPEPTIDEMLESLKYADDQYGVQNYLDIRAILEQHKDVPRSLGEGISQGLLLMHPKDIERGKVEAIRAFVGRVEHAWRTDGDVDWVYRKYVMAELAALEKEN